MIKNNYLASVYDWFKVFAVYKEPAALRMLLLGFVAGLPQPLVFGTLSFRLREVGIERTTIGFFSWILFLYAFKFLWAPLVDKLELPLLYRLLGRRRSWLLLAQLILVVGLLGMAIINPQANLLAMVLFTFIVTFGSTLQDIVVDAYRIESAPVHMQASLAATYQTGYRLAMLFAGAGALWLAAQAEHSVIVAPQLQAAAQQMLTAIFGGTLQFSWFIAYFVMAAIIAVIMLFIFAIPEPQNYRPQQQSYGGFVNWCNEVALAPFVDFFKRYQKYALWLLLLIATFRISDILVGAMANTFFVDAGYSKEQIAAITKIYGTLMTIGGTFLGGVLVFKYGLKFTMLLGVCGAMVNNLLYALLSYVGFNLYLLTLTISVDNLNTGIASAAFITFLSALTNKNYTATQYAIFSSLVFVLPKFLAGFSGWFVDTFDYGTFFLFAAALSVPVFYLVYRYAAVAVLKRE